MSEKYSLDYPGYAEVFVDYNKPKDQRLIFKPPFKLTAEDKKEAEHSAVALFSIFGWLFGICFMILLAPFNLWFFVLITFLLLIILQIMFIVRGQKNLKIGKTPIANNLGVLLTQMNEWIGEKKMMTFTRKDVKEKKITIPFFENTSIEYKTTKDFNKYLERIEIKIIPLRYKIRIPRLFSLFVKQEKFKLKRNDSIFSANFYFKKTPQKGNIHLEWS